MKKKLIPVLLAIVLIVVIAAIAFGGSLIDRFSYSKERADLNSYYGLEAQDDIAIVLQDEIVEEKAKLIDGVCYFDLPTVEKYFTDRFYVNTQEQVLLYTTATDVIRINIGDESNVIYISGVGNSIDYRAALYEGDTLYIAADYVKRYANLEYTLYDAPLHMQVYTSWGLVTQAELTKKTAIRYQGGVKSNILEDVEAGDTVTILEEMENWTKVKSQDAYIGYVENKYLSDKTAVQQTPVTDAMEITYNSLSKEGTINMAFHQVFAEAANSELSSLLGASKAVNVVAPVWFRLNDNAGGFASIASASYVQQAHNAGVDVWAVITDVDSKSVYDVDIDFEALLSSSQNRANLIANLMQQADTYGLDGINIDFEKVRDGAGSHFVQFLRELSIETHKRGIVLSVDNYVPTEYTAHYNRKEQGLVVDYVVVMGYDEYYAGSPEAGPVSSYNYVKEGITETLKEVPAEKVISGIPFFTRLWKETPKTEEELKSDKGTDAEQYSATVESDAYGMDNAQAVVKQAGVDTTWDKKAGQNYATWEADGSKYEIWLEDSKSIEAKLKLMKKYKLAGTAEWSLGQESSDIWNLIQKYVN